MVWERDGFPSHEGTVGVLLPDGTEPGPVYFDTGSGSCVHETTDWWVYDGTLRAPYATRMRAVCSCGRRAEGSRPIDWDRVDRIEPWEYDTEGLRDDWARHIDEVDARTVPLPQDLDHLLEQLRDRLEHLADDAPLAALKAVGTLEEIVRAVGPAAAFLATRSDTVPWPRIAEALGATEPDARSRLHRYTLRM